MLLEIDYQRLSLQCDYCQSKFFRPNHTHIRDKKVHFCCRKCVSCFKRVNNPKRNKICNKCGKQFYDSSVRPDVGMTCSKKCAYALMTKTRKENGSYERTAEQNKKTIETIYERYGSYSVLQTSESRKKISKKVKEAWKSKDVRHKIQQTYREKYGTTHWTKTDEGRKRVSLLKKGKKLSNTARKNMSLAAKRRVRTRRETMYTSANGGFREDLQKYFRSNWEANYARILTKQGKTWEYESKSFQLDETTSYTPDFWLKDENTFVEVKGRVNQSKKFNKFRELFPELNTIFIGPSEYTELRSKYKDVIMWEGK